ncbi:hypothetical protein BD626DRAFT_404894, partial [Schizophyllum amplum]
MWLKDYLTFGPSRPLWAYVADALLAHYTPKAEVPQAKELRINPFLQTWQPYKRAHAPKVAGTNGKAKAIPPFLHKLIDCAERFGLRLECLAPSRSIIRNMPMWYHIHANQRMRSLAAYSKATRCLRDQHRLRTVGDFEETAARRGDPRHEFDLSSCECSECEHVRTSFGCENPDACFERAEKFLDTLPGKWDPRGEHPEDHRALNEAPEVEEWTAFDRDVVTTGHIGNTFRIFTDGPLENERLYLPLNDAAQAPQLAATDGSCLNNGERDAQAGAGVYLEGKEGANGEYGIHLPPCLEQSNQTGEMLAIMVAADEAD